MKFPPFHSFGSGIIWGGGVFVTLNTNLDDCLSIGRPLLIAVDSNPTSNTNTNTLCDPQFVILSLNLLSVHFMYDCNASRDSEFIC